MNNTRKMITTAFFIALGLILPMITGHVPAIGKMLLPMHIPVLLCGMIVGWQYGLAAGVITPLLRSFLFGMPPLMPVAAGMAFELAAYGAVAGLIYSRVRKNTAGTYLALIIAMLMGRVVWGLVSIVLYGIQGNAFSMQMFLAGAFLNAVPGIVIQLLLIPALMAALRHAKVPAAVQEEA